MKKSFEDSENISIFPLSAGLTPNVVDPSWRAKK